MGIVLLHFCEENAFVSNYLFNDVYITNALVGRG